MDIAIVLFGLGIGLLVGMTGMGGASLMTPLLILVFGISPVTAIGTDIFYAAVTKTVGGYQHLKLKTVHRGIAFWLAVGSVPSALLGVYVIEVLQRTYGEENLDKLVLGMLGGALLVVGVATLLRSVFFKDVIAERYAIHLYRRHIIAAVLTGAVTGLRDRPHLGRQRHPDRDRADRDLPPHPAARRRAPTSSTRRSCSGRREFAHWVGGNIDFVLAGNILIGSVPGVLVGGMLAVKRPAGLPAQGARRGPARLRGDARRQGGRPSVVIPAIAVASLIVGSLFAAQAISQRRLKKGRTERPPAPRRSPLPRYRSAILPAVSEKNVEIIRRIYDGWGRGDFNEGVDLYDRYVLLVLRPEFPDPGPYLGQMAIRGYMRGQFLKDFEDATITGEEFIDAGDSVVVRIRQSASGSASGLPVEMSYYNVWTLRGGSIIRIESIMKREDALAAVGLDLAGDGTGPGQGQGAVGRFFEKSGRTTPKPVSRLPGSVGGSISVWTISISTPGAERSLVSSRVSRVA